MDELLDKVKGRIDEELDKVKGQCIEKVNDLEEKNKRLQVYIQDLRNELVKERSNSRKNRVTTTTPDFGEDKKTDREQDSLSDSASDNDMEPASFITNVLVMDKVFGYLDVKQLKECRLICKDWNEAASSILSRRTNGNGLGVNLAQVFYEDDWDDEPVEEGLIKQDDLDRAQEMHSIVEAAPETWFRTVYLEDSHWATDVYKSVFQDFGSRIKVINIKSEDLHIQTLRSILLDYCPNLEELGLPDLKFETDAEFEISRPLKLTRLSFKTGIGHQRPSLFQDVAEVVFTIMKNSPDLKKLESFAYYTTVSRQIFLKLQRYPQIMNNLEEIFLRNAPLLRDNMEPMQLIQDPLEPLSNIQFESKLKKLVLTEIKPQQSGALIQFLNMTNESLEKLTLRSHRGLPASAADPDFQLKQMNRLWEFRYHVDQQGLMHSIDNIDILVKMPNLKIFVLGFESSYKDHDNKFIGRMFSNCRLLMRQPHKNLKELYLFGCFQNHRDLFEVIERGFPNLNKLVVRISLENSSTLYYNYGHRDDFFKGISKLKNLTTLFLHLGNEKFSADFRNSFLQLKNLSKLMHLTMQDAEIDFDETSFMAFPKLQRLTFIGVKMSVANTKRLMQLLDERGIFFDIKKRYQLGDAGVELDPEY